jgi:Uma2 family endonuclease
MARVQLHEPEMPMTRDEFLAWASQQPTGRFERIDGIVVAMAPERASHNLRKGAVRDALRRAIAKAGLRSCQVFGDGMTVQVEDSDFEPDALARADHHCRAMPPRSPTHSSLCKSCLPTAAPDTAPPS